MSIMIMTFVYALLGASLLFLMRTEGVVSLGQGAFWGIGAYSVAILSTQFDAPLELTLLLGAAAAGLGGLIFAIPCARLSPAFAAMLTLVFTNAVYGFIFFAEDITRGADGLMVPTRLEVWPSYYLALLICICGIALLWYLPTSRLYAGAKEQAGRVALVDGATPGPGKRRFSFAVAGMMAGLAGGLYALYMRFIVPESVDVTTSLDALSMLVVGGVHSFLGAFIGPAAVNGLGELARDLSRNLWSGMTGAAVIVVVLSYPRGISGFLEGLLGEKDPTDTPIKGNAL